MKKILMSAALFAIFATGCTEENDINEGGSGDMFTLEVTRSLGSRTTLGQTADGFQTYWSAGDQVYVTSEDGNTSGVLTLAAGDAGSTDGRFTGLVFGKGKLTKVVFPVPTDGVLDLSEGDANEIDAPMTGNIEGNSATLINACAMIKLNIINLPEGADVTISGDNIYSSAVWENGALKNSGVGCITIKGAENLKDIFVPVFVKEGATSTSLNVQIGEDEPKTIPNINIEVNKVTANGTALIYDSNNSGGSVEQATVVETEEGLSNALNGAENGSIVYVAGEIDMPTENTNSKEVHIVGVGDNVVINQPITDHTDGGYYDESSFIFENVTFVGDGYGGQYSSSKGFVGASYEKYINCTFKNYFYFSATEVDVIDCTFDGIEGQYFWTGTADNIGFEGCIFNGVDRAVKVCNVSGGADAKNVSFTDCEFYATETNKNVLEIDSKTCSYTVSIDGCQMSEIFPYWYAAKGANPVSVSIDGYNMVAPGISLMEGIYGVHTAEGLKTINEWMSKKEVLGTNAKIALEDDIDFAGYTWTPVDSHADTKFWISEIDGRYHVISNLTINGQAMFNRFAGQGDVVVKNLTFNEATVNSNALNTSILTVQSYQNVLLDNVDVKGSEITGAYKVAPLIATVYDEKPGTTITASLKNCDVSDCIVKATSYDFCTTGMVAFVYAGDNDKIKFENCSVKNVRLIAPEDSNKAHAAIYTTGSESLFNAVEGVTVSNVTFEALED